MKKILLFLGVLMGLVVFSPVSYALRAGDTSLKTYYNVPLVSSAANGNTSFVTGSVQTGAVQQCTLPLTSTGTTTNGTLMSCGSTPITGIGISGGASGGTVTIYDANTNGTNFNFPAEAGPAEALFEAIVASNTFTYVDLGNNPINAQNGVVALASSTSGVVVYKGTGLATNQ